MIWDQELGIKTRDQGFGITDKGSKKKDQVKQRKYGTRITKRLLTIRDGRVQFFFISFVHRW